MTGGDAGIADTSSDEFAWGVGDAGTIATPAADTIDPFDTASAATGGRVLKLQELHSGKTNKGATLVDYPHLN